MLKVSINLTEVAIQRLKWRLARPSWAETRGAQACGSESRDKQRRDYDNVDCEKWCEARRSGRRGLASVYQSNCRTCQIN